MKLRTYNFYQAIKEKTSYQSSEKYLLADQDTYRQLRVDFPFRTSHYGIGYNFGSGESKCRIGSSEFTLHEGCLITVGPGIITQWDGLYALKNETIYFSDELLMELSPNKWKTLPFFLHGGKHVIRMSQVDREKITGLFHTIRSFQDNPQVISGLIFSLMKLVEQFHKVSPAGNNISVQEQVTQKFKTLLAQKFLESKEVGYFASLLNLTPKYLSEVLTATTGKSAKELINEHILLEAKSLLKQTDMTVNEIAYWLGYEEASYFVRFFKKNAGKTPLEYRSN